jgi:hypothetical protein
MTRREVEDTTYISLLFNQHKDAKRSGEHMTRILDLFSAGAKQILTRYDISESNMICLCSSSSSFVYRVQHEMKLKSG